jgi:transposase
LLKRLGFTYKKTLKASEQDREDVKTDEEEWQEWIKDIPVKSLVFIDESCARTNMCKLYGRSLRGVYAGHDSASGSWKTTTMLSSIGSTGETECLVFDGAVDGKMFAAYMENCLLPVLKDNDYVMMENLSAHKNSFDITKFEKRSIAIKYLPAYNPDFNPIEKMWSKIKCRLREYRATTKTDIFDKIGTAFSLVTTSDAKGWFKSCGYFQ